MIATKLAASYAPVIGRALLAVLFLQSGWDKVFNFQKVAGVMAAKGLLCRKRSWLRAWLLCWRAAR